MTRIRATCPTCGEVDLRPTDVSLEIVRLADDDEHEVRDGSNYRFACPSCEDTVTKPADARIARLLTTGGVEVHVIDDVRVDTRPTHPEEPAQHLPALDYDDLLDFHFLLDEVDVVDAVRRAATHAHH